MQRLIPLTLFMCISVAYPRTSDADEAFDPEPRPHSPHDMLPTATCVVSERRDVAMGSVMNNIELFPTDEGYSMFWLDASLQLSFSRLDSRGSMTGVQVSTGIRNVRNYAHGPGESFLLSGFLTEDGQHNGYIKMVRPASAKRTRPTSLVTVDAPVEKSAVVPAVAWNSAREEYGVIWSTHDATYFGRVSASGKWVRGSTKSVSTSGEGPYSYSNWRNPMISTAHGYLLPVVTAEQRLVLLELGHDGAVLSSIPIGAGSIQSRAMVAVDAHRIALVTWQGKKELHVAQIDLEKKTAASKVLHVGGMIAGETSVIHDGDGFAVAYMDSRNPTEVWFAKLQPGLAGGCKVKLTSDGFEGHDFMPVLTFERGTYVVSMMHGISPASGHLVFFDAALAPRPKSHAPKK